MRRAKHLERLRTNAREVFEILQCSNDKQKFQQLVQSNPERFCLEKTAVQVLSCYANFTDELNKLLDQYEQGGHVDMCQALKDWEEEALRTGRAEGQAEGEKLGEIRMGLKLIQKKRSTVEEIAAELNMPPSQFWEEARELGLLDDLN